MRYIGMAKQKTPVGDIDLKSPSVEDLRKVSESALGPHWHCCCGAGLSLQR